VMLSKFEGEATQATHQRRVGSQKRWEGSN
jgi:hypothetical protein